MLKTPLSRRSALIGAASMPLAATGLAAGQAHAAGHAAPPATSRTFMLGDFTVSTLLVGTRTVEEPQGIFGMNVSPEEFADVSAANFLPTDAAQFFFTPTVVNTGSEVVLFDTGLAAAPTLAALNAAGYSAEDIDVVVITHFHGDHIGGLSTDGTATFPNARYVTGRIEYDTAAANPNDGFTGQVAPLAEQMSFVDDGATVAPGITSMAAFGHTPGHMTYMLDSADQQLLIIADLTNHPVWSLAYPDWEVRFDRDKEAAAATRRRILGMLAAERMPFIGYHMPFPALGYVDTQGDGFRYVPESYQFRMSG